jgi:hypothetical protein
MKTRWFALTLCLIGLAPAVTFAGEEKKEAAPAVVTLQFRNYAITVSAGDKGTLYTVKEADGKLLGEQLTASELQAKLPDVHRFVKDAFAGDRKAFIDASIDSPAL